MTLMSGTIMLSENTIGCLLIAYHKNLRRKFKTGLSEVSISL